MALFLETRLAHVGFLALVDPAVFLVEFWFLDDDLKLHLLSGMTSLLFLKSFITVLLSLTDGDNIDDFLIVTLNVESSLLGLLQRSGMSSLKEFVIGREHFTHDPLPELYLV